MRLLTNLIRVNQFKRLFSETRLREKVVNDRFMDIEVRLEKLETVEANLKKSSELKEVTVRGGFIFGSTATMGFFVTKFIFKALNLVDDKK
jgi:hypothetical protein